MTQHEREQFGPWHPGIVSPVPERLLHLCTIFRPENVSTSFAQARELRGITGLAYDRLVAFRPDRLALHELLVRVSADLSVPDGPRIGDLGINFRRMASDILAHAIEPQRARIAAHYATVRAALEAHIGARAAALFTNAPAKCLAQWDAASRAADDPALRGALSALAAVGTAVLARHGRAWGTPELIASMALTIACNEYGSEEIGRLIAPWIAQAARESAYARLPTQREPVVMNTKGASASGKSTIRPLQRRLAAEIGTRWCDYALISPDIWRKQLLDYASLGAAYKYAGAFTGDELRIVDQKLDQYMVHKAARHEIPHLLIDRFRFDSFAPDSEVAGSNLLTRFGSIVYLFFMITPPAALVERAWRRGLDVGRYKPVDDTLAHAVEAYSGMPELFFTWIRHSDKRVHFEFLDNAVPLGAGPRSVAFGWNERLIVLDVKAMLDVSRFRRTDTGASAPAALFPDPALLAPERNADFLRECVLHFREVSFADQASGHPYLQLACGSPVWVDPQGLSRAAQDEDTLAGLRAAAPGAFAALDTAERSPLPPRLTLSCAAERRHTLGRWGSCDPRDPVPRPNPSVPAQHR